MTRLAIVDQSAIQVPFNFSKSVGVILAFNGEIYNWQALREELSNGTPWETDCDAEVIARAWRTWGPACLTHFNGMFGLALVDLRENVVFLARDRAGEKPLYYRSLGGAFSFASEIKALPGDLREGPCAELATLEFDCLETTPFEGVRCLGPGEYLLLRGPISLVEPTPTRWWSLPPFTFAFGDTPTFDEAVEQTQVLIVDAVRLRTSAAVPLAVQLSGGLDSAIIQAVARAERLYTVTFPEDGVDCLLLARAAAAGHADKITPISFGYEDLRAELVKIAYHLDTPATWTAVCQWFMNKRIAADGATIVLSGEGADELFGGYARYRFLAGYDELFRDPRLAAYEEVGVRGLGSPEIVMAQMLDRSGANVRHAHTLIDRFGGHGATAARMARVEWHTTMQCLLRMADRMSAAFGLENRSPFLDHRVIEFAAKLPMSYKITATESKAVLMAVARRLGVPAVVVDQPTKRGLFVPWARWTGGFGWGRGGFVRLMRDAWQEAFNLRH